MSGRVENALKITHGPLMLIPEPMEARHFCQFTMPQKFTRRDPCWTGNQVEDGLAGGRFLPASENPMIETVTKKGRSEAA
jgi:hypothetical protein